MVKHTNSNVEHSKRSNNSVEDFPKLLSSRNSKSKDNFNLSDDLIVSLADAYEKGDIINADAEAAAKWKARAHG